MQSILTDRWHRFLLVLLFCTIALHWGIGGDLVPIAKNDAHKTGLPKMRTKINAIITALEPQFSTNTISDTTLYTPGAKGQLLVDTLSPALWYSGGTTTNDWIPLNGSNSLDAADLIAGSIATAIDISAATNANLALAAAGAVLPATDVSACTNGNISTLVNAGDIAPAIDISLATNANLALAAAGAILPATDLSLGTNFNGTNIQNNTVNTNALTAAADAAYRNSGLGDTNLFEVQQLMLPNVGPVSWRAPGGTATMYYATGDGLFHVLDEAGAVGILVAKVHATNIYTGTLSLDRLNAALQALGLDNGNALTNIPVATALLAGGVLPAESAENLTNASPTGLFGNSFSNNDLTAWISNLVVQTVTSLVGDYTLDVTAGTFFDADTNGININTGRLYDNGVEVIGWRGHSLTDPNSGEDTVNWEDMVLVDTNGDDCVQWNDRVGYAVGGGGVFSWKTEFTFDSLPTATSGLTSGMAYTTNSGAWISVMP